MQDGTSVSGPVICCTSEYISLHFKLAAFNIIKYLSNIQHNYTHHVLVNRGDI